MTLDVSIQVKDARWKALLKPYCRTIEEAIAAALAAAGHKGKTDITVVLADDVLVRQLNRDFRGKDKPTNVLSFPSDDHLGDIVLARQTVEREAKEQGKNVRAHAIHLLIHGTLHLLGFDHEKEQDASRMEGLEIKILEKLGFTNPYL